MSAAPQRPGYELEFEDDFEGSGLDTTKWFPYMLPHWTTEGRSAARYAIGGGSITMRIDEDSADRIIQSPVRSTGSGGTAAFPEAV